MEECSFSHVINKFQLVQDGYLRSRVQKFPARHTTAAPNGKCCEIYSGIYGEVNVSVEKCVEIKGDYVEK